LEGEITVNGEIFLGTMPPLDYLTDREIAQILTYVGSNFKNNAEEVTSADVQRVRRRNQREAQDI
jgi:mono/diheme cytochrome c family protein